MHRPRRLRLPVLAALTAGLSLLAGCGGGSGDLEQDLGTLLAEYQVLDLATGQLTQRTSAPDLTGGEFRDRYVVFRRVDGGSAPLGTRSGIGGQGDEPATSAAVPTYYLAVFELTRAQWQRLAGTTPWADLDATGQALAGTTADVAAVGISRSAAQAAFQGHHLALPSPAQWEKAARAGATTAYAWGDTPDEATVAQYARVDETHGTSVGPSAPGRLQANAWGFYDMAGNVWELTSGGGTSTAIRGGSWHDTVLQARCANQTTIDSASAHALVGVRPVLVP